MNDEGAHWDSAYKDHFGSWTKALETAGIRVDNTRGRAIDRDTLLEELCRLAEELGHQPTTQEMEDEGHFSTSTYYRHFESWTAALEEAFPTEDS